jgi:hypothetical protein
MEYLKIRNWNKWQTYRADRGQPPWIKIHRRLMRNPEWVALTDAERGQLVSMWLLAADHDGVIPASTDLIQKLCYMESKLNLNKFIELGFISQNGVNLASEWRQPDQPEAKAEADKNKEYSVDFLKFYSEYPNKKEKQKAYKKWNTLKKEKKLPSLDNILSSIQQQKRWRQNANGEFRPEWKHPATWLNNGCWDDECETSKKILTGKDALEWDG